MSRLAQLFGEHEAEMLNGHLPETTTLENLMFRVDPLEEYQKHSGFLVPPNDRPYFTGRGGLHFWKEFEDAKQCAKDYSVSYVYACIMPSIDVENTIIWDREFLMIQPHHTKHTLVIGVQGYNRPRKCRNEIVLSLPERTIYKPELLIRIHV